MSLNVDPLTQLSFPPCDPEETTEDVQTAYAKASAYVTLALVEAGVDHSRGEHAAAVTDATYTLDECDTPEAYLDRAQQELAYAIAETTEGAFRRDLKFVNQTISMALDGRSV